MATIDTYTQVVASAIFKNAGVKPYLLFGGQRYANPKKSKDYVSKSVNSRFVILSVFDGELESNAVTVTVTTNQQKINNKSPI